jgi:hypothetical protein
VIELADLGAATDADGAGHRVDADVADGPEVQDDAVVAGPVAGSAVAPPAHRELQPGLAGEIHGRHDVGLVQGLDDDPGTAVVHGIVHGPGLVVTLVVGGNDGAADLLAEILDSGFR